MKIWAVTTKREKFAPNGRTYLIQAEDHVTKENIHEYVQKSDWMGNYPFTIHDNPMQVEEIKLAVTYRN